MHLTQGQLELIAQIAPVFLLLFVVERRALARVPDQLERLLGPIDLVRTLRKTLVASSILYFLLLTAVTLGALFASGSGDGLDGVAALLIVIPFVVGVATVVVFSTVLIQLADEEPGEQL
jgi:UDP-N-acetylmuramyl pentapeptide phosphotransferase/UDP-N-acetylglucosamine-1-phosphate transferase